VSITSVILADNPVVYYKLDESSGSVAADATGHGNAATYGGPVTYGVAGPGGTVGVRLGSAGSVIGNAVTPVPSRPWSLECWFALTAQGVTNQTVVANFAVSVGANLLFQPSAGNTTLNVVRQNIGFSSSGGTVSDTNWHHVVWTFDASNNLIIYLDGAQVVSQAGNTMNANNANSRFQVGTTVASTACSFAHAALYNVVLTSTQVSAHYSAAAAVTSSRTVAASAAFLATGSRTVPAIVQLSGTTPPPPVGFGLTGRVGEIASQPGRIQPGNPQFSAAGGLPQVTRTVPASGTFSTARVVPLLVNLGGLGLTSIVGIQASQLTRYMRVGLRASVAAGRSVPTSLALASVSVFRTTQAAVETLGTANPNLVTVQAATEVLTADTANLITTQAAAEVLTRVILTLTRTVPLSLTLRLSRDRSLPIAANFRFPPAYVWLTGSVFENTSNLGIRPSRLGAGFALGVSGGIGPASRQRAIPLTASFLYTTTQSFVTQAGVEAVTQGNYARVTQAALEVAVKGSNARVTQAAIEVVVKAANARVTQAGVEVIWSKAPDRLVPMTGRLSVLRSRSVPIVGIFTQIGVRGVPISMRLRATSTRQVPLSTRVLSAVGTRSVPLSASVERPRPVPLSAALRGRRSRNVPLNVQLHRYIITVTHPSEGGAFTAPSFFVDGTSTGDGFFTVYWLFTNETTGATDSQTVAVNSTGNWAGSQPVGSPPLWNAGDSARLDVQLRDSGGVVVATTTVHGHIGAIRTRTVPFGGIFSPPQRTRSLPINTRISQRHELRFSSSAYLGRNARLVPLHGEFTENKRHVPLRAEFFVRQETILASAALRYVGFAIPTGVQLSSPTNVIKPVQAVLGEPEPVEERFGDYVYYPPPAAPGPGGIGGGATGGGGSGGTGGPGGGGFVGAPPRITCNTIVQPEVFVYDFFWISWGINTYNQLGYDKSNTFLPWLVNVQARRRYHRVYPGQDFALGMSQGRLYHWGTNNWGQRSDNIVVDGFLEPRTIFTYDVVPPQGIPWGWISMPPVQQAAVGNGHCAALDVNGSVWTWGRTDLNQTGWGQVLYSDCQFHDGHAIYSQPYARRTPLGPARFITAGENFTLVLGQDNSLAFTGSFMGGTYGWSVMPHGISERIVRVRAGRDHAILVTESGDLYAWGTNEVGQLGLGDTDPRTEPTYVASNVLDASPFWDSTLVLFADGSVAVCGDNTDGQCGQDFFGGYQTELQRVNVPPIEAIMYGCLSRTAMVITQESSDPLVAETQSQVWGWGANNGYQLLDGSNASSPTPRLLGTNLLQGLEDSGFVVPEDAHTDPPRGVVQIAVSADAVYASDEDFRDLPMTVEHWRTWGQWDTGALGAGRVFFPYQHVPGEFEVPQTGLWRMEPAPLMLAHSEKFAGFYVVRGRTDGAMAMDRLGRVHNWGLDNQGQLGTGAESFVYSPHWNIGAWSPVPVPNIESGWMGWAWDEQNFIRIFEGSIMAWGKNDQYQLGLGHNQGDAWVGNTRYTLPISVPSLEGADVQKMIGTDTLSIALLYDGRMFVAGTDVAGLVGPPGWVYTVFTPVA